MKKQSDGFNSPTIPNVFIEIGKIYLKGLRGIGAFLAFVLGTLICAAVIVLPFWYLARNAASVFTYAVLVLAAGGGLFLIIRRTVAGRRARQEEPTGSFVRFLWNFFCIISFLGWIYLLTVLALLRMHTLFILLTVLFFIAFGLYLYARKKSVPRSG